MTSKSDDPTPSRDTGRRWTIPADHQWVIGRKGGAADIGLRGTQLDKQATVRWTGRAVEIRAAGTQYRPVVDGKPVVHAPSGHQWNRQPPVWAAGRIPQPMVADREVAHSAREEARSLPDRRPRTCEHPH